MPRNEPISVPKTTTARAPSSAKASLPWCLGSRRAIIGARKMPAATNDVATQNRASWTCQVRIRLYGSDLREIEPEEAVDLGAVVLGGGADERLDQEQRGHHEEEPRACPLSRRQRHVPGRAERQARLLATVPAQEPPAPEDAEQDPDAAQQRDQREDAPDDHVGGGPVVDSWLGRPVVGVGVVVARAIGRAGPRGPSEEGGQLAQLGRDP